MCAVCCALWAVSCAVLRISNPITHPSVRSLKAAEDKIRKRRSRLGGHWQRIFLSADSSSLSEAASLRMSRLNTITMAYAIIAVTAILCYALFLSNVPSRPLSESFNLNSANDQESQKVG